MALLMVVLLPAAAGLAQTDTPGPAAAKITVYTQWPFDAAQATTRQQDAAGALGVPVTRQIELADGVSLSLVLIPAGQFVMGAPEDESRLDPDESPPSRVTIRRPFWIGALEITNKQYRLFRPEHNSRSIDTHWKDRVGPGPSLDAENQPVIRISCLEARSFCAWLSHKTGQRFRLPTEPEWEYACRAGTDTPVHCPVDELAKYANFADASLKSIKPWALRDGGSNDGSSVSAQVGKYLPNAWGVYDMHGNVAEWCDSTYAPYPFTGTVQGHDRAGDGLRVVRGGSWDDRPRRCRSAFRLSYPADYRVYNVGFRVVCGALAAK